MKTILWKLTALLLTAALLLPTAFASFAFAADAALPIVCVCGEGEIYATKEDGTRYLPKAEYADEVVASAVPELIPLFAKAFVTNDYREWSEKALEALAPIYADIKPSPDGTLPEGTSCDWSWSPGNVDLHNAACRYYNYWWDFRLSPLEVADDLQAYIQEVKRLTGAEKVVLEGRCAGVAVQAAYLTKYGTDDVAKCIFVCNALHGFDFADLAFSGKVTISGAALYRYLQEYDLLSGLDARIYTIIMSMLRAMNKNASADEILSLFLKIYDKIGPTFIGPFLREFYGVSLGYVAMVDEHFDDYLEYVFPTAELKAEYAPIIAKAKDYHEMVQCQIDDLLQRIDEEGTPVYFIAVYGEQQIPVGPMSDYQGDQMANAKAQSFGATTAKMAETLPESYLAAQREKEDFNFISPDKQIDASTCMFPYQTWFIKNLRHWFHGDDLMSLLDAIAHTDNAAIDTLAGFPQYLNAKEDHSALEIAQEVNENDVDWAALEPQADGKTEFLAGGVAFFARIIAFFSRLVKTVKQWFGIA
ncbi:MAG: hypothetical protein IJK98_03615 [Clostridia bacterium]|nr:hypothetical protein [Clostridia bacterium]